METLICFIAYGEHRNIQMFYSYLRLGVGIKVKFNFFFNLFIYIFYNHSFVYNEILISPVELDLVHGSIDSFLFFVVDS